MTATKKGAIRAFITPYYVYVSRRRKNDSGWTSDPNHRRLRRCQVSEFCDRTKRQSAGRQQVRYNIHVCMYMYRCAHVCARGLSMKENYNITTRKHQ